MVNTTGPANQISVYAAKPDAKPTSRIRLNMNIEDIYSMRYTDFVVLSSLIKVGWKWLD